MDIKAILSKYLPKHVILRSAPEIYSLAMIIRVKEGNKEIIPLLSGKNILILIDNFNTETVENIIKNMDVNWVEYYIIISENEIDPNEFHKFDSKIEEYEEGIIVDYFKR